MSSDAPGKGLQFGRYRLIRRLATGGMGEIFLAEMDGAAGINKKVVIKRILPHLARDPKFVERFLDEGRLVAQLSHGNLVPIFDIGIFQGQYFLAMEHVDGIDLDALARSRAQDSKEFPLGAAVHVLDMVARALDYVHTRVDDEGHSLKIVHRDISPQNIMISLSGEVKILDFGIARARTRHVQSLPGFVAGKIPYMSPEQLSGEETTPQSDIYGLGAMVYQLLTDELPHRGDSESELIRSVQNDEPTSIESHQRQIPLGLAALINKCIAQNPEDRPASAADLRRKLTEVIEHDGLSDGEAELRSLVEEYSGTEAGSNSFDDLLVQQMDGAWESVTDSIAGAMTRSTRNVEIEVPHQDGLSEVRASLADHTRLRDISGFERRGFKRWIFLATVIGLGLGLGLMVLLEKNVPKSFVEPVPKPSVESMPKPDAKPPASGVAPSATNDIQKSQPETTTTTSSDPGDPKPIKNRQDRPDLGSTRIVALPSNAHILVGKKLLGTGRAILRGPKDRPIQVTVSAPGYESSQIRLNPGSPGRRAVTLKKLETGTVAFRFYPANALVFIDGKAVSSNGNNRITRDLVAGRHVLILKEEDGGHEKSIEFELGPNQHRVLGTINLKAP